jgi:hypothetical protein
VANRLVDYFAMPNYLNFSDGRPVFVLGDFRNIRDADGKKCADAACSAKAAGAFLGALRRWRASD